MRHSLNLSHRYVRLERMADRVDRSIALSVALIAAGGYVLGLLTAWIV